MSTKIVNFALSVEIITCEIKVKMNGYIERKPYFEMHIIEQTNQKLLVGIFI